MSNAWSRLLGRASIPLIFASSGGGGATRRASRPPVARGRPECRPPVLFSRGWPAHRNCFGVRVPGPDPPQLAPIPPGTGNAGCLHPASTSPRAPPGNRGAAGTPGAPSPPERAKISEIEVCRSNIDHAFDIAAIV